MVDPNQADVTTRYTFRHGVVHDPDDRMARYVVKLSTALGDLRLASKFAVRRRQARAERLYFVRLTASHLRELINVMDPPDRRWTPTVEEFLTALPRGTKPGRTEIRKAHAQALRKVDTEMAGGRPLIESVGGALRPPRLRDDLRNLRNAFFHYGHDEPGDGAVAAAMRRLDGEAAQYVIRQRALRANYADDIGFAITHPFPIEFASDMHRRIVRLIGPCAAYVQRVEAAWFFVHQDDVTVRRPGVAPVSLRTFLKR